MVSVWPGVFLQRTVNSNNLIAARSLKVYHTDSVSAGEITGIWTPDILAGYHTKPNVNSCYEVLSLKASVVRLKPKVNVNDLSAKMKLKSNFKAK